MAIIAQSLLTLPLSKTDIKALPKRVLDHVGRRENSNSDDKYLLTRASTDREVELLERLFRLLPGLLDKSRNDALDEYISELVEVLVRKEEMAEFDRDIAADNALLRANYLTHTATLTAEDIHVASGLRTKNRSEPASRWTREGKIFAIKHQNINRYPAFQFKDARPRPVVAEILKSLPQDYSSWERAFWFASSNGWLDNRAPQDCIDDEKALLMAAEKAQLEVVG